MSEIAIRYLKLEERCNLHSPCEVSRMPESTNEPMYRCSYCARIWKFVEYYEPIYAKSGKLKRSDPPRDIYEWDTLDQPPSWKLTSRTNKQIIRDDKT